MKFTIKKSAQEVATIIGATIGGKKAAQAKTILLDGLTTIEEAQPGDVTFLANPGYQQYLSSTKASAVIVTEKDAADCSQIALVMSNPRLGLAKLIELFTADKQVTPGIHPSVIIGNNCQIAKDVSIAANCVIGDDVVIESGVVLEPGVAIGKQCHLGARTVLKANVVLYDRTRFGYDCIVQGGAVIGSDGFGFAQQEQGAWVKLPHLGRAVIGNQVEIGANTTIDRGFLGDTEIHDGVIIDNLVQIAHNVIIGARTAMAGCVGIAGSTKIGADCLIGGAASIAGHIDICDKVVITATSAVNRSISQPGIYSSGFPAKENRVWRKNVARFQFLDKMASRIRKLEQELCVEKTE